MSKTKIITYDLRNSNKNYNDLYEKIQSYGVWARICESVWFISTADSCQTVCRNLMSVLDADDRIFVTESTGEEWWYNTICGSDYLQQNM